VKATISNLLRSAPLVLAACSANLRKPSTQSLNLNPPLNPTEALVNNPDAQISDRCLGVRNQLNKLYLNFEHVYEVGTCELSFLDHNVLDSISSNLYKLKRLQNLQPECTAVFEPLLDVYDPVNDYAKRSFQAVDQSLLILINHFVKINRGFTTQEVAELELAFRLSVDCYNDLSKVLEILKLNNFDLNLDLEQIVDKLRQLAKLLARSNMQMCTL